MDVKVVDGAAPAASKVAWGDEGPASADLQGDTSAGSLDAAAKNSHKLGLIKGVFVPTLQNILGIILFLRLPKITGHAGIGSALAIVLLSCGATTITSLSMSAVATNGVPKSGGCYSIIKESIGPEFGGTVGLLLFLSNNFGVAMYVIGFVEILDMLGAYEGIDLGDKLNTYRIVGAATLACLFLIVFIGIKYIARFAILFLSVVLTALACIGFGTIDKAVNPTDDIPGFPSQFADNFAPKYGTDEDGKDYSFGVLLAIFFPACTDPLAGSNLSGDLRDPQRSIPPGTLLAVAVTTVIFSLQVIFCGGSCNREFLRFDSGGAAASDLAWPVKQIVYAGAMTSTLGAGLQSLAGAPRLLAAIASDRLIPQLGVFAPKPGGEPRLALCLCGCLSFCCIMLGRLELVAPFITMWFLACYAVINGAASYLAHEDAIHFRPRWKYFHWSVSLIGALVCAGMMFFIKPLEAAIAVAFGSCIYKYIQRTLNQPTPSENEEAAAGGSKWSMWKSPSAASNASKGSDGAIAKTDWQAGRRFQQVRNALLAVQEGDFQFKYWRPFILFLCHLHPEDGSYEPQHCLLNLIAQLNKRGKGLAVVGGIIPGDYHVNMQKMGKATAELTNLIKKEGVDGFPEILSASSVVEGRRFLVQGTGLGVLRPNTVMMGWPEEIDKMDLAEAEAYTTTVEDAHSAGKTVLLCKATEDWPSDTNRIVGVKPTIDAWWIYDLQPADGILLIFPFLLLQHTAWASCKLRIFIVAPPEEAHGKEAHHMQDTLEEFLKAGGIVAEVKVILMTSDEVPRYNGGQGSAKPEVEPETGKADVASEPLACRRSIWEEKDAHGSRLTNVMARESGDSELVVITLPDLHHGDASMTSSAWLKSVDELVSSVRRVIFVQQSGQERVQFFSNS